MARILVVEDVEAIREIIRLLLELDGHTVVEAANGLEALAHLSRTSFNLLIINYLMPKMDGLSLLGQLHTDTIPIIFFSAKPSIAREAIAAGADIFIASPIKPEELIEAVNQLLPEEVRPSQKSGQRSTP